MYLSIHDMTNTKNHEYMVHQYMNTIKYEK